MVKEVDLGETGFSPLNIESLGDRDEQILSEEYGDAATQGIKGTLLPNAVPGGQGRSAGFDPEHRMPIVVDPDIDGASYVLEPDSIKTKEEPGQRPRGVPATDYDKPAVRTQADRAMRKAAGQPKAMKRKEEPMAKRAQARRRSAEPAPTETDTLEYDVDPHVPRPRESTELPKKLIAFDFGPPIGTMETRYHDIYRESDKLILAWDVACINASKYKPANMGEHSIKVTVGREREEYEVHSLGLEFTDEATDRFYIILLIVS